MSLILTWTSRGLNCVCEFWKIGPVKLVDSRISVWNFWNEVTVPGGFGRQGRQARQGRVRGVIAGGTVMHQEPSSVCSMGLLVRRGVGRGFEKENLDFWLMGWR